MAILNGQKIELSQEQLQSLADEINNDLQGKGYAECTSGGIVELLNHKELIDNPTPQGEIDGDYPTKDQLLGRLTLTEYELITTDQTGQLVFSAFDAVTTIDFQSTLTIAMMAKLVTDALFTQERIDELTAPIKIPDPSWQAQIPGQSRIEELLGAGYMVEGADIEATLVL